MRLGDITRCYVDAIVNAANESLLGGGGVDGAIHQAAGPGLLEACRALPEVAPGVRCPPGAARITSGFELPARFVIHTVGPVWRGGSQGERETLARCYRRVLDLVARHGLRSVAFPSISTGAYGFPIDEAAPIALREIRAALARQPQLERVTVVLFSASDLEVYQRALTEAGTPASS